MSGRAAANGTDPPRAGTAIGTDPVARAVAGVAARAVVPAPATAAVPVRSVRRDNGGDTGDLPGNEDTVDLSRGSGGGGARNEERERSGERGRARRQGERVVS